MTKIWFQTVSEYGAYGRNGTMKTAGLVVSRLGDELELRPITGCYQVSNSARVSVPLREVDAVVDALRSLKRRMELQAAAVRQPIGADDIPALLVDDRIAIAHQIAMVAPAARGVLLGDPDPRVRRAARHAAFSRIDAAFGQADHVPLLARLRPDADGFCAGRRLQDLPTPLAALVAANLMHHLPLGVRERLNFWPETPLLDTLAALDHGTPVMALIADDPVVAAQMEPPAPGL